MPYAPTVFIEGAAPGLSAVEMNKLGTQHAQAVADITPATKEFFAPCLYHIEADYRGREVNGAGDKSFMRLLVPHDFSSLTSIEAIILPDGTGASMHFQIITEWAAYNGGEDYNVHTETAAARDIGATVINQYVAHDISDLVNVAALAVGDLLIVQINYNATAIVSNARISGIRFRYS